MGRLTRTRCNDIVAQSDVLGQNIRNYRKKLSQLPATF